ncbi:MAG: cell division protein ZapA [Gammaproteobacteria bacterium]|nr:MAG: cell division protein ZapA [Gammaproteobacteria bacterium]
MADDVTTISVTILDKDYQVSCPVDEVDALTASARYLDQQMAEIRESGKILGSDRIAVMAALNIANEFLNNRESLEVTQDLLDNSLVALTERVSQALEQQK